MEKEKKKLKKEAEIETTEWIRIKKWINKNK